MPTFFSRARLTATPAVNAAVAGASSLPALVANVRAIDPALATQLEAKPIAMSKSPWGTLAVAGAAWASAKFGFGWDAATDDLVGGAGLLIGAYLMRWVTNQPIAGWFKRPAPVATQPAAAARL